MDLYLIRHADALPLGEQNVFEDADRPLSPAGEKQAQALAGVFRRRGIRLDRVAASPLLRAHQTAEGMLGKWLPPAPALVMAEELAPGGRHKKLAAFLRDQGPGAAAVVGHQPDLNHFAAWLIGGKKADIDIAKAGVACITFENGVRKGKGVLKWLVTPEWYAEDKVLSS